MLASLVKVILAARLGVNPDLSVVGGVLCGRVGLVGWLNGLQVVVGRVGVGVVCWPGRGVEAGRPNGCSQMRVRM